jgi:hypothetical protein
MRWRRVVCWRWRWFWKAGTAAVRAAGMDRQALRDPVHRYTAQGLQGLINRQNLGAPKHRRSAFNELVFFTTSQSDAHS